MYFKNKRIVDKKVNMDSLKFFSKALAFISELNKAFSKKYPSIQLYYKLLKKTPIGNTKGIQKQNEYILSYLTENSDGIKEKDIRKLKDTIIQPHPSIFLEITKYLKEADGTTRNIIFSHLQLLSYISNPSEEWKTALQTQSTANDKGKGKENAFLDGFISKIEKQFDGKEFQDPMTAAMSMMQSGLFSEIMQSMSDGVQNGDLDPKALLSTVQSSLTELTGSTMDINGILSGQSSLNVKNENGEQMNIDMNQMFNMVGNVMGGLGGEQSSSANPLGSLIPTLMSSSSAPDIDELEKQMSQTFLNDTHQLD